MKLTIVNLLVGLFTWQNVFGNEYEFISQMYENRTDPGTRQLYEFRKTHPVCPIITTNKYYLIS